MTGSSTSTTVRPATAADALDVRRILDGAMLEFTPVESRIEANDVLVATDGDGQVRGVIVLEPASSAVLTAELERTEPSAGNGGAGSPPTDGAHVDAIAVRTRHRDRGIGSALVASALEREGRLTAHFDTSVRPFYESLGFEIVSIGDGRFAGVRER